MGAVLVGINCLVFQKKRIKEDDSLLMPPYIQHHILWMKSGLWCGWWWLISLCPWSLPFYSIVQYPLFITCHCCFSVSQSCPTLCNPIDCSTPGFPVCHHLWKFAQTHVLWVGDAIQPSHPLSPPSPQSFPVSRSFPMHLATTLNRADLELINLSLFNISYNFPYKIFFV